MHDPIRRNDLISLRDDIPQHNLSRGQIGRVLQVLTPNEFEADFVDSLGKTIAKVRLKAEEIIVFRHEATLDAAGFWKLIEDAKAASNNDSNRQVQILIDKVAQM